MATTHLFEKCRPTRIAEAILLPEHREVFERFIAKGGAPHILLVGPPGVGKTSVAMALANDLNWQVMKKNAAAYTNIEAVRTEIAQFALPPSHLPLFDAKERHRCVLLDEGDHMPEKAQAALRGVMEEAAATDHSNFIVTANDGKKIDPAIRSRCAVFDFSYPHAADRKTIRSGFRERIVKIADAENLELDGEMIDSLLEKHGLDLRAMLNELQKHT